MKWVVVVLLALGVGGCNRTAPEYAEQDAQYQRQLDQADAHIKRNQKQMDDYDRQTKVVEENLQRQSELLDKQEEQSRRMDAILDAMEKQHGIKR